MRDPTISEVLDLAEFFDQGTEQPVTREDVLQSARDGKVGIVESFLPGHPSYSGKMAVVFWSEVVFVSVVTYEDGEPVAVYHGELS